ERVVGAGVERELVGLVALRGEEAEERTLGRAVVGDPLVDGEALRSRARRVKIVYEVAGESARRRHADDEAALVLPAELGGGAREGAVGAQAVALVAGLHRGAVGVVVEGDAADRRARRRQGLRAEAPAELAGGGRPAVLSVERRRERVEEAPRHAPLEELLEVAADERRGDAG